ncbi:MAG: hypothetical protein J1F63_01335, partial [Oscillospiraceae bacterium]|nr:hypothetical protein [Oscillospiraceae bacterium]
SRNYYATGTHKTVLSGTDRQEVYFGCPSGPYSNKFNYLDIKNKPGTIAFLTGAVINVSLSQPGGALIINPEYVTLDGRPAFKDMGELNPVINRMVGNAENVIPTWKDVEKYNVEGGKKKNSYRIREISIKDTSGESIDEIPQDEEALVTVEVAKVSENSEDGYVIIAVYGSDGALLNMGHSQTVFEDNVFMNYFDFNIPALSDEVGEIKAFVWQSLEDPQPLAESKTF